MIVEPTPRSKILRKTALSLLWPVAWIAASLSLLPLRRFVEPPLLALLEILPPTGRRFQYSYAPEHFPWWVAFLVAVGVGFLILMARTGPMALASDRRVTRFLQDRIDQDETRNTRTLDDA